MSLFKTWRIRRTDRDTGHRRPTPSRTRLRTYHDPSSSRLLPCAVWSLSGPARFLVLHLSARTLFWSFIFVIIAIVVFVHKKNMYSKWKCNRRPASTGSHRAHTQWPWNSRPAFLVDPFTDFWKFIIPTSVAGYIMALQGAYIMFPSISNSLFSQFTSQLHRVW